MPAAVMRQKKLVIDKGEEPVPVVGAPVPQFAKSAVLVSS
jgi:hypothetical protein